GAVSGSTIGEGSGAGSGAGAGFNTGFCIVTKSFNFGITGAGRCQFKSPFTQTYANPTRRIAMNTPISQNAYAPISFNTSAHGNRKTISTSKRTKIKPTTKNRTLNFTHASP